MNTEEFMPLAHEMLKLQNSFNQKVHPQWETQKYAWRSAIWVECAEMLDHLGYKWWKHQEPNMDQVVMELVDIWHFGMSHMMESWLEEEKELVSEYLVEGISETAIVVQTDMKELTIDDIKEYVAVVVNSASDPQEGFFNVHAFFNLWFGLGKSLEDLYKMYIGKNALNIFRQNNGYKDGTYIKVWSGREDNEYLTDIIETLPCDENLMAAVLNELDVQYAQHAI
jgi:dimeric dUTPase (all-alpha-NTP-PPase superfamily)